MPAVLDVATKNVRTQAWWTGRATEGHSVQCLDIEMVISKAASNTCISSCVLLPVYLFEPVLLQRGLAVDNNIGLLALMLCCRCQLLRCWACPSSS